MADLRDLARTMRITAKTVETGAIDAVKEVYTKIGTTLVYATPIDTSRARANHQGTVGSPATEVLFQPPAAPPSPRAGTDMALQSIRAAAAAYSGQKEGLFIANNLDYIDDLNNGSSGQAPANFIEQAVMAGVNAASSVKIIP